MGSITSHTSSSAVDGHPPPLAVWALPLDVIKLIGEEYVGAYWQEREDRNREYTTKIIPVLTTSRAIHSAIIPVLYDHLTFYYYPTYIRFLTDPRPSSYKHLRALTFKWNVGSAAYEPRRELLLLQEFRERVRSGVSGEAAESKDGGVGPVMTLKQVRLGLGVVLPYIVAHVVGAEKVHMPTELYHYGGVSSPAARLTGGHLESVTTANPYLYQAVIGQWNRTRSPADQDPSKAHILIDHLTTQIRLSMEKLYVPGRPRPDGTPSVGNRMWDHPVWEDEDEMRRASSAVWSIASTCGYPGIIKAVTIQPQFAKHAFCIQPDEVRDGDGDGEYDPEVSDRPGTFEFEMESGKRGKGGKGGKTYLRSKRFPHLRFEAACHGGVCQCEAALEAGESDAVRSGVWKELLIKQPTEMDAADA